MWGFYGRTAERREIDRIIGSGRFFFCSISGRRRIGKTTLVREALSRANRTNAIYMQVPDSDERGVVQAFREAVEDQAPHLGIGAVRDFPGMSSAIRQLWDTGCLVILDEFQYFHRRALSQFQSFLQRHVDDVVRNGALGGLIVLGSTHTEMSAILDDQVSPLFNRITHKIELGHWDFSTLLEMFHAHEIDDPGAWLFYWSIFEGVPKFYRDCFEVGALDAPMSRQNILRRTFFEGASPLRDEANNWYLRELRGRYDSVLKLLARKQPCAYGELMDEYRRTGPGDDKQLGGYLSQLIDRYRIVEVRRPIFSKPNSRKGRYTITDNFLSAWLAALSRSVEMARFRPIEQAVAAADMRLMTVEGHAFEKIIGQLIADASRAGRGPFSVSDRIEGYWNHRDIEIDIVAWNEDERRVWFGSCKRDANSHTRASMAGFEDHVQRFLRTAEGRRFAGFDKQVVAFSPSIDEDARAAIERRQGDPTWRAVDLKMFETWLT